MILVLESFFIVLGLVLLIMSYAVYEHFTWMPNVKLPKRLSVKSVDSFQFYLARDWNSGLLLLSPCPVSHPLYEQALHVLYEMPELTFEQVRYLRDLQYTFELAMSAYMIACFNDDTIRLAAKFMEDMHILAKEMYAISRRLNLAMQVRFPRECDDPILVHNQLRSNYENYAEKSPVKQKIPPFRSATDADHLFNFKGGNSVKRKKKISVENKQ